MPVRSLLGVAVFLLVLGACAAQSEPPAPSPSLDPTATLSPALASTPEAATPVADLAEVCGNLTAQSAPGLYVLAITPFPELIWNWDPRLFRVDICNTFPGPTPEESRFAVFVYFPGESRPRGQTSELHARLGPGLNEITLGSWVPGMQNHISACVAQPPVELSVGYIFPPDLNVVHSLPFRDGKERMTFTVQCGGTFP